jgi:hypothetical protein
MLLCYILQTKSQQMPQDSAVSVVNRLSAAQSVIWFQAEAKYFQLHQNVQTGAWDYQASYSMATRGSFPMGKGRGMRLTTHLHPVLRLRMSGAVP